MTNQAKPRIFLCHAHEDKPKVRELYHQLKEAGYHPWLDEEDLLPGQTWRAEIKKILSDPYNLVVVCLSGNSITKRGTVQREIKWALDVLEETPSGTIYLIPARLEECQVPDELSDLQWVDLFEAGGFDRLKRALDFEIGERTAQVKPEAVRQAPQVEPSQRQPPPRRQPFEPQLILIPAGEFLMGSDPRKDKAARDNEQPQHTLRLPDYYIANAPVTNFQYLAFVQLTGHDRPKHWKDGAIPEGKDDHPVVWVRWMDAMAYCQWLAKVTGRAYRLPSEAEWEKAARGGLRMGREDNPYPDRIYPWGDKWDKKRCNSREGGPGDTTPVGQYSPGGDSPYGCVDMAGNVWEWTLSLYRGYLYAPGDGREDTEAEGWRVLRGGSWYGFGESKRAAYRNFALPDGRAVYVGFRCVVEPGG